VARWFTGSLTGGAGSPGAQAVSHEVHAHAMRQVL